MNTKLCLLFGILALASLPVCAADDKKKDGAADAGGVTLDQLELGEAILNGPVSMDDLKGKVVVVEFWGIR